MTCPHENHVDPDMSSKSDFRDMSPVEDAISLIYTAPARAARQRCHTALARMASNPSDKGALVQYVAASAAIDTSTIQEGAARRALKIARPCEG